MELMKQLLAGRNVTMLGRVSENECRRVHEWFPHARFIAENFEDYDHLRRNMMHKARSDAKRVANVRDYLEGAGLIYAKSGGAIKPVSHDADMFLRGQWLEEYAYMAFCRARADAVTFHQQVHWEIDQYQGNNEIDVIARVGDRLSFVSCKALRPYPTPSGGQSYRSALVNFLNEIDNAQDQFGYPWDTAFMFTTTALQAAVGAKGSSNETPYGSLLGKARALDVYVLGLEDLPWRRLLPYMTKVVQEIRTESAPNPDDPIHGAGHSCVC